MHIDDIPRDSFFTFDIHAIKYIYLKLNNSSFILYKDYKAFKYKDPLNLKAFTMSVHLLDHRYAENVTIIQSIVV